MKIRCGLSPPLSVGEGVQILSSIISYKTNLAPSPTERGGERPLLSPYYIIPVRLLRMNLSCLLPDGRPGMRVLHCAAYIYGWQAKRHYAHDSCRKEQHKQPDPEILRRSGGTGDVSSIDRGGFRDVRRRI